MLNKSYRMESIQKNQERSKRETSRGIDFTAFFGKSPRPAISFYMFKKKKNDVIAKMQSKICLFRMFAPSARCR